jgi:phosphoribosylaminoimidazole-succinocarboxamide synthase
MTSVKEFHIELEPTHTEFGRGSFEFTDDYSVFDWGRMPDEIPDKGASLCLMGAYNFELLEAHDIKTHYRGLDTEGTVHSISELEQEARKMAIHLTQVPDLPYQNGSYDYSAYHDNAGENYLIPLEIVFRNTVPIGSSLRNRTTPSDHGLEDDSWPETPVELTEPIIEFSTKYEEQDRYLTRTEADTIAGKAEIRALESIAHRVNSLITEHANEIGFEHQDGKIECLYHQGEIYVADVVGTFDENRFGYKGQQLSKEVLRQYYKAYDPDWVAAVTEAKNTANQRNIAHWQDLCNQSPKSLPEPMVTTASHLYTAGANTYLETNRFAAPSLDTVIKDITNQLAEINE